MTSGVRNFQKRTSIHHLANLSRHTSAYAGCKKSKLFLENTKTLQ